MKKTTAILGAVACLGAGAASAQSNVEVYGTVDVGVAALKYSGDADRVSQLKSGGMSTSHFGFKGTEDLGGGLKAHFNVGGFFRADTGESGRFGGDTLFSRDANVAISGDFGKVQLGRGNAPSTVPVFAFNPFGDSFTFSPLVLHAYTPSGNFGKRTWIASNAADSGWSNLLVYSTPAVGGLKANLYYQFGEKEGDSGKRNVGVNLFYANGPLGLTAFYHNSQVGNPNSNPANPLINEGALSGVNYKSITRQKGYFVGGSYDFSVAKLFATYQINDNDTATAASMKDKTFSLGLSAPLGSGKVLLGYANTKRTGSLVGADLKRDTVSLGYDYALSKRTDLYTILMSDKITSADRAESLGVGIRHRF